MLPFVLLRAFDRSNPRILKFHVHIVFKVYGDRSELD